MALHGCGIAWHWCMDCAIMRRKSQVLEEYEQQPWTCGELSSLALHLLILNLRCTIAWVCKVLKNKCSRSDGWFLLQLNGFEEQRAGLQSINPKKSDANWSSDITMTGRCVAEFRPHFAHFRTKRSCKSWSQAGIFARGNLSREVRAPYQTARTMTLCDIDRLPMWWCTFVDTCCFFQLKMIE